MAVGRRFNPYSGIRLDIPHLKSLESAVSYDFDSMLRGMVTGLGRPYLIRGFNVVIPEVAIDASNLVVQVADSAVLHPSATESGTIMTVPAGTPDETLSPSNSKVVGSFQPNAINYVSLDFRRYTDPNTLDQTAGWSPSQQLEYQRSVAIGRVLDYKFIISANGFSTNLPLWVVETDSNRNVVWIKQAVSSLFRLGSGGANPNPQNNYNWGNLANPQFPDSPRREWISANGSLSDSSPLVAAPGSDPNAFKYGDFVIGSLKDWMDAIMTRFKEVTGSDYWYTGSKLPDGDPTVFNLWWDTLGSVMTGAGELSYNLVLEAGDISVGRLQQSSDDPTISIGDVFVEGVQSRTKASLTMYSGSRLIINSMTSAAFVYGEDLLIRRQQIPLQSQWVMEDFSSNSNRFARLSRESVNSWSNISDISSWSYVPFETAGKYLGCKITVQTVNPHTLAVGDFVNVMGLETTGPIYPEGVFRVTNVTAADEFSFYTTLDISGTPSVGVTSGISIDANIETSFSPKFPILDYESVGMDAYLDLGTHNFKAPINKSVDLVSGSNIVTVDTTDLKVGQLVESVSVPPGTTVVKVNPTTVELSEAALATITEPADFVEQILILGLDNGNDVYTVRGLDLDNRVMIQTPTPEPTDWSNAYVQPLYFETQLTVTGADQDPYNVTEVPALILAGSEITFLVGSDALPPLGKAVGSYKFNVVIARSTVLDPVLVNSITNDGLGNLTVTTATPHGLIGGPATITIYGDSSLSQYIRTYTNVVISPDPIDDDVYQILGTGIISGDSYTNPGSDKVFSKFADNPYPGPVAWSSDIVVKAIVGDYSFVIPKTATVDTTDPDNSILANVFNVNGVTGTAYIQDGEVLYVKLERNEIVSNGTTYATLGAAGVISTTSYMTDIHGQPLEVGDWLKFQDEGEAQWLKIRSIAPTSVYLETDTGQNPDIRQRPAKSGVLVYSKGKYEKLYVKKHHLVDQTADIYWLAVRRDNNGGKSKVYFKSLEIEAGEVRQINDNQNANILTYIGAPNEGAINPNYSVSGQGDWAYSKNLQIENVDQLTRMVTFVNDPEKGFQKDDQFVYNNSGSLVYFTVTQTLSSKTVIVAEDTQILSSGQTVTYFRLNKFIQDQDNLTLAIRKEDRQAGHIDTMLQRPIYDESIYIQKIQLAGSGTVKSGSYVYTGSLTNPTAFAWVIHGNQTATENIESATISMPGGHPSIGSNAILAHIYFGNFNDGDGLSQNGAATGLTVDNPGNPSFPAPSVYGNLADGVEIVLPPNRRTQVVGSGYVVFGTHCYYKASTDANLAGEDLLVIVNDGIRSANIDYIESFGGPKGKLQLVRNLPPNTRMRFRVQSSFGSALAAKSSDTSLQAAYNVGSTIATSPNRPVEISSDNVLNGNTGLMVRGSIAINGGTNAIGGIFNEANDQEFVIGRENNKPKEVWSGLDAVKTHASHPGSAWKRKTSSHVTTVDTPVIVPGSEIAIADGDAARVRMTAIARRSDGTLGVASFSVEGTFYRIGGTLFAAGSPITNVFGTSGEGYTYAAALAISGTDVVLAVYGSNGNPVQWAIGIDWQIVNSPS